MPSKNAELEDFEIEEGLDLRRLSGLLAPIRNDLGSVVSSSINELTGEQEDEIRYMH